MKISFLIAAHIDIIQLNRLINSLIQTSDIYIHLDKKANSPFNFLILHLLLIPIKYIFCKNEFQLPGMAIVKLKDSNYF